MSNEVQFPTTAGASAPLPATPSGVRAELIAGQASVVSGTFAAADAASAPLPTTPSGVRAELIALQTWEAQVNARRALLLREAALHEGWGQSDDPRETGLIISTVGMELAPALRMHPRAMENRVSEAVMLLQFRPVIFQALESGSITQAHVDQIRRHTFRLLNADLSAEQIAQIDDVIVELAQKLTPSELVRPLKQIVEEVLPESLAERHSRANEDRFVELVFREDGMAELRIIAPAYLLKGANNRLNDMSHAEKAGNADAAKTAAETGDTEFVADGRTINQICADIATDLLLDGTPASVRPETAKIQASIDVSIDADVLTTPEHDLIQGGLFADTAHGTTGADPDGFRSLLTGTVDGYVPVFVARDLASCTSSWQRLFQNPDTGALLTVDNYVPTTAQRRLIETRDQHCRFPGCRQPLRNCDADHSTAWADGGQTKVSNLAMLCRRHHTMKHAAGWAIRHLGGGELEWTSPQGHRYTSTPEITVAFIENDGDDGADSSPSDPGNVGGPNGPGSCGDPSGSGCSSGPATGPTAAAPAPGANSAPPPPAPPADEQFPF